MCGLGFELGLPPKNPHPFHKGIFFEFQTTGPQTTHLPLVEACATWKKYHESPKCGETAQDRDQIKGSLY